MNRHIQHAFCADIDRSGDFGDDGSGGYLKSEVLTYGASLPWEELLRQAAGEPLTTRHWAAEWDAAV